MVAPIFYRSTDVGAPSLTGNVGSLITLLDACLVNGYGSKAAAGWTKEFSGTNKAVYRMGAGGTADRMYLRVWDDNTGVGQCARVQGYRTMSSVDVGVRPFAPFNYAADVNGLYAQKTAANGDAARAWALIASPTAFWVFNEYNTAAAALGSVSVGLSNQYAGCWFFGEYKKRFIGHAMNVAIFGSHYNGNSQSQSYSGQTGGKRVNGTYNFAGSVQTDDSHWIARPFAGTDGPATFGKIALSYYSNNASGSADDWGFGGSGPGLNPSIVDAKLRLSKIELMVNVPAIELIGEMPGAYQSLGNFWLPANQVIGGVGALAGNSYFVGCAPSAQTQNNASNFGQILINLTDW